MEKEIKDGAKVFVLSTWKNEEMEEIYRATDMVVEVGPGEGKQGYQKFVFGNISYKRVDGDVKQAFRNTSLKLRVRSKQEV